VPEFLKLPKDERHAILSEGGARMRRLPNVLEKDVWICWVLDHLFRMPGALRMAFKGGTSLSKVYGAIARFSEDLACIFHE
jgi:predicted nucleotidyltransferase component of viral defense system